MTRTTTIIAAAGVLLCACVVGVQGAYSRYFNDSFDRQFTCATYSQDVEAKRPKDLESRITYAEYLEQRGLEEDELPPLGSVGELTLEDRERLRAAATTYWLVASEKATQCTRAAIAVGVRNGAIVLFVGALVVFGVSRIRRRAQRDSQLP